MVRAVLIVAQVEGLMLFRYHKHKQRAEVAAVHEAVRKAVMALATMVMMGETPSRSASIQSAKTPRNCTRTETAISSTLAVSRKYSRAQATPSNGYSAVTVSSAQAAGLATTVRSES